MNYNLAEIMVQVNTHLTMTWWWEVITTNRDHPTLILIVTVSVLILALLWTRLTLLLSSSTPLPPGPRHLPIVGYLPFLSRDLHTQFTNMAHTYGPIFKFYVGSKLHVVINTPELAKVVVRDQDESFANRSPTVAASILTYGGQDIAWSDNNSSWRNLRKILSHEVLSNKNLEACRFFRRDEVRKTIKNVYSKMGTPININEISFLTEANVLTRMVWENSAEKGVEDGEVIVELQRVVSRMAELTGTPNLSDFFPSLAWLDLQGIKRGTKGQLKQLEGIFTSIIEDRIKSNSQKTEDAADDDHEGKKDFLQILLELKDQKDGISLDITKIKALLLDIITAGTETTAIFIEWAMTEIMQNHNVMKSVQKELVEVVGLENVVEESHLPNLKYLDATIKETFRLHPVVPFLMPRSPNQDCLVAGYTIPRGCIIFINVWSIHRDPRYWDNPTEFNPERFLAHMETKKWDLIGKNLKFLPFGAGRRQCPGIPLAEKMQMYILASLLHSFDWNLPEGKEHDLSDKLGITLQKRKPLIAISTQRLPNVSLYM